MCNLFFVAVFTLEAVLKLFAFGVTIYFVEAWNRFDLTVVRPTWPRRTVILFNNTVLPAPSQTVVVVPRGIFDCCHQVIMSIVGLFVNAGVGANVVRVFRIARAFRLLKKAKALNALFQTLVMSIPSLWNIGSLLFVMFFIFAVLGTCREPRCWRSCLLSR